MNLSDIVQAGVVSGWEQHPGKMGSAKRSVRPKRDECIHRTIINGGRRYWEVRHTLDVDFDDTPGSDSQDA